MDWYAVQLVLNDASSTIITGPTHTRQADAEAELAHFQAAIRDGGMVDNVPWFAGTGREIRVASVVLTFST